ncbi:hypothetical protein GX50_03673 [[Emmonsia] crescens]|uniref:Uncharacterized protein n=1 Tax=[Emmonsia] crescens TaxID=73230 RepID=A0A2B7ZHR7_9EURO|nr:hypothetical protein GX50_03673 [Emmonsia crescens]
MGEYDMKADLSLILRNYTKLRRKPTPQRPRRITARTLVPGTVELRRRVELSLKVISVFGVEATVDYLELSQ